MTSTRQRPPAGPAPCAHPQPSSDGSPSPSSSSSGDDRSSSCAAAAAAPVAAAPAVAEFPHSTPLVFQVGRLGGPTYWDWVNRPVPGKPRFFASDWAEGVTKTEWWVVPLLWLPVYAAASAACFSAPGASPVARLASLQLLGLVLWQAFEYGIHRCAFHAPLTSYWGITLHFLFHGCHHKFPTDAQRLVFPPLPAAAIAAAIFAALRAACAPATALGLMSGVLLGYVAYDCLHYAIHHGWRLPGPMLRELRARHLHHHYHDHHHGFGISSVAFDALLGTQARL